MTTQIMFTHLQQCMSVSTNGYISKVAHGITNVGCTISYYLLNSKADQLIMEPVNTCSEYEFEVPFVSDLLKHLPTIVE